MDIWKRIRRSMVAVALLLALASAGCMFNRNAVVVEAGPTCEEALSTGLQGFSDEELAGFLDSSLAEGRTSQCWIPVMETCLNENREIPHRHLAEAVKAFNKQRHEALFHKAVYRYMADIAKGKAPYRAEDRLLLESYCSVLINSAHSAGDKNLGQAQVLCRKLDAGLYRKFFE
jgi:hypothetical protein